MQNLKQSEARSKSQDCGSKTECVFISERIPCFSDYQPRCVIQLIRVTQQWSTNSQYAVGRFDMSEMVRAELDMALSIVSNGCTLTTTCETLIRAKCNYIGTGDAGTNSVM